jgi:hypothetical protein
MFILTIDGRETEGAYAVLDEDGDHILYIFEEEDDAMRFAMMLEDQNFPEMNVIEVDDDLMIKTCEMQNYQYTIITKDDIVIPPEDHDFI